MKFKVEVLFVITLLLISLGVRIYQFEYPGILSSKWGDGSRDYLVAHSIRTFGERPLIGPFNLLFESGLRNSPLYYYILAVFLTPYDNFLSLGYINIILQILAIALIYLITRTVFDSRSAIVALVLFSFSPVIIRQTEYIWQPNLMQPVALLGIYLLVLSHFKKSYRLLICSLFVFVMAGTLHNSVYSWFIQIFLLSFLILKLQKKAPIHYLGVVLIPILSVVVFYIPVLVYFLQKGFVLNNNSSIYLQSVNNYLDNLVYNLSQTLGVFSINNLWILLLTFLTLIYLRFGSVDKKLFFVFGFLFFIAPILVSSFFNKNQLHYLTISFPILAVLIAVVVSFILEIQKGFLGKTIFLVIVLLLLKIFSQNLSFLKLPENLNKDFNSISSASSSIDKRVSNNPHSFQIISFAGDDIIFRYPTLDTILLVPLEKELNLRLTKTSDDSPYSIEQINDNQYIFVTCYEFKVEFVRDCNPIFLAIYPEFEIIDNVYNQHPISIYLAKRI